MGDRAIMKGKSHRSRVCNMASQNNNSSHYDRDRDGAGFQSSSTISSSRSSSIGSRKRRFACRAIPFEDCNISLPEYSVIRDVCSRTTWDAFRQKTTRTLLEPSKPAYKELCFTEHGCCCQSHYNLSCRELRKDDGTISGQGKQPLLLFRSRAFRRFCTILFYSWGLLSGKVIATHPSAGMQAANYPRPSPRGLHIGAPPEEDVTGFPTFGRMQFSPTGQPSSAPTLSPSNQPTQQKTTLPTGIPTPTPTKIPTLSPTKVPTAVPTTLPTVTPSKMPSFLPTRSPTHPPSASPSSAPWSRPSSPPSSRPSSLLLTVAPTLIPLAPGEIGKPTPQPISAAPTTQLPTVLQEAEEATAIPTNSEWEEFTVAESVLIFLELPADKSASAVGLANIWQKYVESTLELVYGPTNEVVRVKEALVLVDGQSASPAQRRLQTADVVVQNFQIDTTIDLERNLYHPSGGNNVDRQVGQLVRNLLKAENLQQSLDDARVEGVRVAAVTKLDPNRSVNSPTPKQKPTLTELIIGFALVGVMCAMLALTIHSQIKKIRKRRKKRRLAKIREQNSYVMPKQERAMPASPERSKDNVFIEDDDDVSADHVVGAAYTADEESQLPDLPTVGTSDESSDPFATELKQAAVLDDEAWKQLERKREQLRRRGRVVESLYSTAAGSGEEGVEIGAGGLVSANLPYGVDKSSSVTTSSSTNPPSRGVVSPTMQLSPENALSWATGGMALNVLGRRDGDDLTNRGFEPYGETKKEPSLQESWDLNEPPREYFGQYSFMNPLRPRSSDTNNARVSPTSFSEDPSTVAVRTSMSVSSWSEVDAADLRASPTESMIPLGMIRENSRDSNSEQGNSNSNKEDSLGTLDMLQEVQRLSAYVKRYEQKKDRQRSLSSSAAGGGGSTVPYDAMSDSFSAQHSDKAHGVRSKLTMTSFRQAAMANASMESSGFGTLESSSDLSGVSGSEDELSTRLGISRFSIQSPSTDGLLYSVEELPMPAMASPQEESRILPPSPGEGLSMDTSRNISGPVAPGKPMERPHSPLTDLPEDEKTGNLGTPRRNEVSGKLDEKVSRGKLSKLRGRANMLDGEEKSEHTAPSDEFTREERKEPMLRRPSPPPVRSNNRGFNNIISMFESKPATPIAPPNEGWQHGVKTPPKRK